MIFKRRFLISLILCGFLSACSTLEYAPTVEVATSTATETPFLTPTRVWFPPSATALSQAFVPYTATPEMRPGLGETSLRDSFGDPDVWDTASSDQGAASVERSRLTLAVQSEVYFISLRRSLNVSNFYVEITARPSLCRGEDDYGILIRANAVAYYRFALTCNGKTHAERVRYKNILVLQEPIASGDAPPGAPGEVRIGVWAVGAEMRLFLNGRFQFAVNDPSYAGGTIGLFARSSGDTPVTVNFTDLTLREVNFSLPTRTPLP